MTPFVLKIQIKINNVKNEKVFGRTYKTNEKKKIHSEGDGFLNIEVVNSKF